MASSAAEKISTKAHANISREESKKLYSDWADVYDQDLLGEGYNGPRIIRKHACNLYKPSVRSTVRILDIGAGTGLVGKELKEEGFTHIDGLDPNPEMMEKAKKQGIYENCLIEYLTREELNIPKGTYDGITGSGCYAQGEGHMPLDAMYEMIRLVKTGGYVTMTTRLSHLSTMPQYFGLEPLMKQLQDDGKWRQVSRTIEPNYCQGFDGICWTFQVL